MKNTSVQYYLNVSFTLESVRVTARTYNDFVRKLMRDETYNVEIRDSFEELAFCRMKKSLLYVDGHYVGGSYSVCSIVPTADSEL